MECCEQMRIQIEDNRVALTYNSIDRNYSILVISWLMPKNEIHELKDIIAARQKIEHCPWCGKKLPKDLRDEWYNTLVDLGYNEPYERKIPEEFKTDEWWIKRGL
ncbi:MAG: hypothetical protein HRT87_01565 [Legionellales bacterium]|nr:hypothetical protein [Legionellales bacterium]